MKLSKGLVCFPAQGALRPLRGMSQQVRCILNLSPPVSPCCIDKKKKYPTLQPGPPSVSMHPAPLTSETPPPPQRAPAPSHLSRAGLFLFLHQPGLFLLPSKHFLFPDCSAPGRLLIYGSAVSLQSSCLGNPTDGGARWATVRGVAKESDMT